MGRVPFDGCDWEGSVIYSDGGNEQVDRLIEALSTYRQRCVLYCLMEADPVELQDLAREVTAMEMGQSPEDTPVEDCENTKVELYHSTLPKLSDLKVIEYDPRSKTVRYQHPPPRLEGFLDLTKELDPV